MLSVARVLVGLYIAEKKWKLFRGLKSRLWGLKVWGLG